MQDKYIKQGLLIALTAIVCIGLVVVVASQSNDRAEQANPETASQSSSSTETSQDTNSNSESTSNMTNEEKYNKYSEAPPVLPEDQRTGKQAVVTTEKGEFIIDLNGEEAPASVSNFIFLVEEEFYDGLTFHRRVEDFVVQGGDPLGSGTGGPGYTVEGEVDNGLTHKRGAVAMARQGDAVNPEKRSSGSQFYITLADVDYLNGEYSVFGKVTEGMDVVDQLEIGDTISNVEIR